MKIIHSLSVAALAIAGTLGSAWASDDAYVCSIRVDTGFAKESDTAYPHSDQLSLEATFTSEPYCQGSATGSTKLQTPKLEVVRKRKKVLDHINQVRNAWQASVATFQVLSIASAQGAPLNQATVVATNLDAEPAREFAFQATRPASSSARASKPATGRSGTTSRGYVCVSMSKYRLGDANAAPTVDDVHGFAITLFSEPYCRGSKVSSHEYEFGPTMRQRGKEAERLYQATANMNASGLMHAINAVMLEAAMAGQHVTLEHTADGTLKSVEIRARVRDLAKEIKTIGSLGG